MAIIYILIPLFLISNFTYTMEYTTKDFNKWHEKFKIQAMKKLKEEEYKALMPDAYRSNTAQAHAIIRSIAHHELELVQEQKTLEGDISLITTQYTDYILMLCDGTYGLNPITVIDEMTAKVYACSLLTKEERSSLQKDQYPNNKEKARDVLIKFGQITYEQMTAHAVQVKYSSEDYVARFVNKKIKELDALTQS